MAKDPIYKSDDGTRIAALSALSDFEVAEGDDIAEPYRRHRRAAARQAREALRLLPSAA